MEDNASNPLEDKFTGETLDCPNCGEHTLEKFTGGPDVKDGEVTRTEFIYHCRNCDANYTQEEYEVVK